MFNKSKSANSEIVTVE